MASAQVVLSAWDAATTDVILRKTHTLEERPEVWASVVYMMLAGMAVENMLKSIIIARDPQLVLPDATNPEQLFDNSITHHNLNRLANQARVAVDEHRQLLVRLTQYVRWAGRYPFPRNTGDMNLSDEEGPKYIETPRDSDEVDALYETVRAEASRVLEEEYVSKQ